MQVVIDIPNWLYNAIMECKEPTYSKSLGDAVRDGTPLPKEHGRLIDADYAIKQLLSLPKNKLSTEDVWAMGVLDLAPTIIEEESGDKE